MKFVRFCYLLLLASLPEALSAQANLQGVPSPPMDPCGLLDTTSASYRIAAALNWGYGFDSLQADIQRWRQSPFVQVGTIGTSVQQRPLYELVIQDTNGTNGNRTRIWIHARTHPSEVQGTWVTNQIIMLLIGESPLARLLRATCVFTIVPMINPDGVELRNARQNAHGVDIESNWAVSPGEVEVQALRSRFVALMSQSQPIRIALNMHSSVDCRRYFVYHAASGTSPMYASMQQSFINEVRSSFPYGIEPYTFFVSWTSVAPLVYPESWFWYNHHESVLALTYEDKNCASAGGFDTTAFAILQGIAGFLGISTSSTHIPDAATPHQSRLYQNFPNPFNPQTSIAFDLSASGSVRLVICDILGRVVRELLVADGLASGGYRVSWDGHSANGEALPSGTYFARLHHDTQIQTIRMALVR